MSTPDLPTCWYCPACGVASTVNDLPCLDAGFPETKADLGDCPGTACEVPFVPPGYDVHEGHWWGKPCLSIVRPKETA